MKKKETDSDSITKLNRINKVKQINYFEIPQVLNLLVDKTSDNKGQKAHLDNVPETAHYNHLVNCNLSSQIEN